MTRTSSLAIIQPSLGILGLGLLLLVLVLR
jgi:hypothetical protein